MRYTIVKGINDNFRLDLGGDVGIICDVMEIGKAVDAITYEVEFTGAQLVEFLSKYHVDETIKASIRADNMYLVTAYDW